MKLKNYLIIATICVMMFVAWTLNSCSLIENITKEDIGLAADIATDIVRLHEGNIQALVPFDGFRDVKNWEAMDMYGPDSDGNHFEVVRNPDPSHIVKYILIRRWAGLNYQITGYAYYRGNELIVYQREGLEFVLRPEPLHEDEIAFIYHMLHPNKGI